MVIIMENTKSKMIEKLFIILTELDSRENSFNCVISELIGKSWDELCNDAIILFENLKI